MKVIILAGGRGTRLPASAKDIPKALVEVGGKPILQHQLDLLEKHGFTDIRLALGYRAEEIIEYINGKYEYVVEPEPLGTGGAIKFASKNLHEPFMVINGDVISNVNIQKFINAHQKNANAIVISYRSNNTDFGLIQLDKDGEILSFTEKPREPQDGYVSVGLYILQPRIFNNIRKKTFSIEYNVFPTLAHKKQLHAFEHQGFWIDLGNEKRLDEMKAIFANPSDLKHTKHTYYDSPH